MAITYQCNAQRVRRLQDLAGYLFLTMFATNLAQQLLSHIGLLPGFSHYYLMVMGIMAVAGFSVLFKLSSNLTSDFFAASQIGFELFYAVALPIVMTADPESEYMETILYICLGFSVVSIYFWCMLLRNGDFTKTEKSWIVLLPLTYVTNFCFYWTMLSDVLDLKSDLVGWAVQNDFLQLMMWMLMAFLSIGYWKMCHSAAFSGTKFESGIPSMSPFHRSFLGYMAALAVVLLLF